MHDGAALQGAGQRVPEGPPQLQGAVPEVGAVNRGLRHEAQKCVANLRSQKVTPLIYAVTLSFHEEGFDNSLRAPNYLLMGWMAAYQGK